MPWSAACSSNPIARAVEFGVERTVRSRKPERPTAGVRNRLDREPVTTPRLRVMFEHPRPSVTAVAEVVIQGR